MTPELQDLGHRAADCKGWRWMEGMACRWRERTPESPWYSVRLTDEKETWEPVEHYTWDGEPINEGPIPDLSDPATLGCLLALVREVAGDPGFSVYHTCSNEWRAVGLNKLGRRSRVVEVIEPTEAWALVTALETVSV